MSPPSSPPTENAWHGRRRTAEEHAMYAQFTRNVIRVNGLDAGPTTGSAGSSTQPPPTLSRSALQSGPSGRHSRSFTALSSSSTASSSSHTPSAAPTRRRGRPSLIRPNFSHTASHAERPPPRKASTGLDRVYTLAGGGNHKRMVGMTVPRPWKKIRLATSSALSGLESEWRSWEPITGTWDSDASQSDDWEDVVDGVSPGAALDEGGEEVDIDGDPGEEREERDSGTSDSSKQKPKKRYQSSDDPMSVWLLLKQKFLDETLIRAGPGDGECLTCGARWAEAAGALNDAAAMTREEDSPPAVKWVDVLVRCETCGDVCECLQCSRQTHRRCPMHNLRVWRTAGFWERSSVFDLYPDLVHHLGHSGGVCPYPHATRTFTVIHTNGVHRVRGAFCDCDRCDDLATWQQALRSGWYPATTTDPQSFATVEVLELYRLLNVCATVNVRDFVTTLEKVTNPCGTQWVPDRYKSFGNMTRQWSLLGRLRRTGLGHRKEGVASAPLGSAAVLCWACPREGVNLPDDWRTVSKEDQFLFMLYLALDANFRMRSRLRKKSANKAYTILGDGLGYQVPSESYLNHLKNYVKEEDISTCIAFAALMQKDTRLSTGLRATGVGGCVCSRHELVRPLGIGDLLKGERYANMDYIFWAAILTLTLMWILLSYDIGCQWKVHLLEQVARLPALLKTENCPKVRVGTPVWHAGVHEEECETSNSLRYKEGAAMTDGEGVERVWGRLGPWATATREMHVDGRHENLEDVIDQHNFSKNLGLGTILERRHQVAVEERDEMTTRHEQASSTLDEELRQDWTEKLTLWHEQEDWPASERTAENPYASKWKKDALKVADVMLSIEKEETAEAREGVSTSMDFPEDDGELNPEQPKKNKKRPRKSRKSAATFIRMGLQLEQTQRRIRWLVSKRVDLTPGREAKIQENRTSFFKALKPFRNLQATFMPRVEELDEAEEEDDPHRDPIVAENVKLWLPSDVLPIDMSACPPRLRTIETQLRKAQCSEALTTLRLRLHAKSHVIKFRNNFVTGQKRGSRAKTVIDTISDRVDAIAARYCQARGALVALVGEKECGSFFELKPEDVSMKFVVDANAKGARRLACIQGRQSRQSLQAVEDEAQEAEATAALLGDEENTGAAQRGSSKRKLSWIWTVGGGPDGDDEYLHESVRIEWCKSYARQRRWNEEVRLLEVEMIRVLRTLAWTADWWTAHAESSSGQSVLDRGRRAYARRQAAWLSQIRAKFASRWVQTVGTAMPSGSESLAESLASSS